MDRPRWKRRGWGLLLFAAGLTFLMAGTRLVGEHYQGWPRFILLAAVVTVGIQAFARGSKMMSWP